MFLVFFLRCVLAIGHTLDLLLGFVPGPVLGRCNVFFVVMILVLFLILWLLLAAVLFLFGSFPRPVLGLVLGVVCCQLLLSV